MSRLDIEIKKVRCYLSSIESNHVSIALALGFIDLNNLWKDDYKSFNHFTSSVFGLNRYSTYKYLKFCYKFCDIRKEDKFQSYYVKLEFSEIDFTKLCLCFDLTFEEFELLKIDNTLSYREIRKRVKEYFGFKKAGFSSSKKEVVQIDFKLDHYDCYFDNSDSCFIKGIKTKKSLSDGFKRLRENILKDNDNVYVIIKVSKSQWRGSNYE